MSETPSQEPTTTVETDLTAATVREGRPAAVEVPLGMRGESIDRYMILDVLGKGGMGVVYKAYDPDLDRRIALKVVRPGRRSGAQLELRDRLLREAQALAQLAHPNVVAVHDVGTHESDVFLAMELVEGQTLKAWLKAKSRSRREIVGIFAAAGEGLAAAHRQGMVHRDVKPSNIIVGDDGRVRVVDFGLARPVGGSGETTLVTPSSVSEDDTGSMRSSGKLLDTPLTRQGRMLGTPGYMAPEQYRLEEVDAQTDQYAFCVSLYEALLGHRPFRTTDLATLKETVIAGVPDDPDELKTLPTHLQRLLRRGLAVERSARYPSMAALLTDLRRDPAARRRRIAGSAAVLVLVAGAAVAVASQLHSSAPTCRNVDREVRQVWNETARDRITARFESTGRSYAAAIANRVTRYLDSYTDRLASSRVEACRATRIDGTQSGELLDRRMACIDERRDRLAAVVEQLGAADGDVVDHAMDAVQALPRVDTCSNTRALLHRAPPTKAALAVQRDIDRALAAHSVGRLKKSLAIAEQAAAAAKNLAQPEIDARALSALSLAQLDTDPKAAESSVEAALEAATDAGDDRRLARLWIDLMEVIGENQRDYERGKSLYRATELAVRRSGDDPLTKARLQSIEGFLLAETNQLDRSHEMLLAALATQKKLLPDGSVDIVHTLSRLSTTEKLMGRYDDASQRLEQILAIRERTLGKAHPGYGTALYNLATNMMARGDTDRAIEYLERARDILQAALGKDHIMVARTLATLGHLLVGVDGRHDEGKAMLERALAIETRSLGPDNPLVAGVLQSLGDVAMHRRHDDKARELYERALAVRQHALPDNDPQIGQSLASIGELLWEEHKWAESRTYYVRTRDIYRKAFGRDHPFYAVMLLNVGDCDLKLHHVDDAVRSFEEAVMALESSDSSPARLADARFALARALWTAGRERTRAVELANASLEGYGNAGDYYADSKKDVETWLRKH